MRRLGFVALLLVLATRPARAEELTPQEKTWAKTCVDGLVAATPRQRESAAAALARLGPEALPVVLANAARLKTTEHWAALESACVAMGAAKAADALEATRGTWPKPQAESLQALVRRLRLEEPAGAGGGAPGAAGSDPKSPAAVAKEVRRVLASFENETHWSMSDPRLEQLVALGHDAVGALLEEAKSGKEHSFRKMSLVHVLQRVVIEDDLPALLRMLRDGHYAVAPAMKKLPAEKVVPALLAPLERGLLTFDLQRGLDAFAQDPRVPKALTAWLGAQVGDSGESLCAHVAETLGKSGSKDAIPVLAKVMANPDFPMAMRPAASAVANLGDKRGIEALLTFFRSPPTESRGSAEYNRHVAGEDLNRIAGRAIYRGTRGGPGPGAAPQGNFIEAVRGFTAWWDEVKDTLRYDEARRAWVAGK